MNNLQIDEKSCNEPNKPNKKLKPVPIPLNPLFDDEVIMAKLVACTNMNLQDFDSVEWNNFCSYLKRYHENPKKKMNSSNFKQASQKLSKFYDFYGL